MNRVNCQFAGNLGIVPLAFLAWSGQFHGG
jgi:hypothetical protein